MRNARGQQGENKLKKVKVNRNIGDYIKSLVSKHDIHTAEA